jgi:hypothetical protein
MESDNDGKLLDKSTTLVREFKELLVAATGLFSTLISGVQQAMARKREASRLGDDSALKLDPQSSEHLFGREDDLHRLLRDLSISPLVFLAGESGCGKTALLHAGVKHSQAFTTQYLPIYIDMSRLDWADVPLSEIREGLSQALPPGHSALGELDGNSLPEAYSKLFAECCNNARRRPLLLLDQFDDYQTEYLDRFLPKWRPASEIENDNAFWRLLGNCLREDSLSVIVACREEAHAGLDSVRFREPRGTFCLQRLGRGIVRKIIDSLTERPTGKPIIVNPEGGWKDLRDQLVTDLEERSPILPQQLKVVLGGLRMLQWLTPTEYARVNGVKGLEATFVEGALKKAAHHAGMRDEDVLQIVLKLVNRTGEPPGKTPPKTIEKLARRGRESVTESALDSLEVDDIVRSSREAGGATKAWQLDHAYLVQPILQLESERDRWRKLLATSADNCAKTTWLSKWNTLLPVHIQLRLMLERLKSFFHKGQFYYGEDGRYALLSAARLLPWVLALGVGFQLYTSWLEARPWASLTDLVGGHLANNPADLTGNAVPIGRNNTIEHGVRLDACRISRLQVLITRNLRLLDVRSVWGTTVNARFSPYGIETPLSKGDLIALSGVTLFGFSMPRGSASFPPPADGAWGLLVDGRQKTITPLHTNTYFASRGRKEDLVLQTEKDVNGFQIMKIRKGVSGSARITPLQVDNKRTLFVQVMTDEYTYTTRLIDDLAKMYPKMSPSGDDSQLDTNEAQVRSEMTFCYGQRSESFNKRDGLSRYYMEDYTREGPKNAGVACSLGPFQIIPVAAPETCPAEDN